MSNEIEYTRVYWTDNDYSDVDVEDGILGNEHLQIDKHYHTDPVKVEIGKNVTSIRSWCFDDCNRLLYVLIPNSVTNIGYQAFHNCKKLESITIPSSVNEIGEEAFSGCLNLQSIFVKGKTQSEAEKLLSDSSVPSECRIISEV